MRKFALVLLFMAGSAGVAGAAGAAEIECGLSQSGVVTVDGLLDDWKGVKGTSASNGSASDASLVVKCNYDEDNLYLAINVTDERLIRSKKAVDGDDHVELVFGSARLQIWPADTEKGIKAVTRWASGDSTKWLSAVDSLQAKGWSVEIGMPLGRVPGGGKGVVMIPFAAEMHDADSAAEGKTQDVVSTGDGMLVLAEAAGLMQQFLDENKLTNKDVILDVMANVDGEPGLERVVAAGKLLAVIGSEYSYISLPVSKAKDVLEVKVLDLSGEGKASLVARYVERGGGGSREVLAVWNLKGDGSFNRTFAHELGKQLGTNRVTSKWEIAPRTAKPKGKKKPKQLAGYDIVIRPGDAVGFTQDTWGETPAEDMIPILLPWSGAKQEVWHFSGDEYSGGAE